MPGTPNMAAEVVGVADVDYGDCDWNRVGGCRRDRSGGARGVLGQQEGGQPLRRDTAGSRDSFHCWRSVRGGERDLWSGWGADAVVTGAGDRERRWPGAN